MLLHCNVGVGIFTFTASELVRGLPIIGQGSSREVRCVSADGVEVPCSRADTSDGCWGDERMDSGQGSGEALLVVKMLVGMPEDILNNNQARKK